MANLEGKGARLKQFLTEPPPSKPEWEKDPVMTSLTDGFQLGAKS
ncbi:MAG: hypothetical protein AM325_015505 [Candidatus Thorarchaeota archaeon SMTZ1-45]